MKNHFRKTIKLTLIRSFEWSVYLPVTNQSSPNFSDLAQMSNGKSANKVQKTVGIRNAEYYEIKTSFRNSAPSFTKEDTLVAKVNLSQKT